MQCVTPLWHLLCACHHLNAVCETTVALVVRKGNPKGVNTWEDLLKPGVQIIVANPKTAGVARWIFLALWGSKMKKGDAAAIEYITKVRLCLFRGTVYIVRHI